jgi:hypothetical protein
MLLGGALTSGAAFGLEVDREVLPRLTLGGVIVGTLDAVDWDSDPGREESINSEDSFIALRLDKRLYEAGVAGAMVGFREDADTVHFSDHYVFYWNPSIEFALGHAPLRNTLVEFPTLRDDDLAYATLVANASSAGNFDQTHGDVARFDWFPNRGSHGLGVWAASRVDDGSGNGVDGIDTVGLGYIYEPPEPLRYIVRVRRAGVLLDRQEARAASGTDWMNAWIAGASVNLNEDPSSNWSLDAQLIRNSGVDGAASVADFHQRSRAASRALVVALRHTARPALLTRWQVALTAAVKEFDDVDDSRQWSLVPGVHYELGQGVSLLAQYAHTAYGDALGGGVDRSLQIGLSFSLEARFNDTIGERNSILNREHGYIP